MDKTIKINIAGTLFQIDDEAFRILKDYLQSVNNRFKNVQGGHETIEDIESRIAEIFLSQNGITGVITTENVNAMISIIGKPEDFGHVDEVADQPVYNSQQKRMYRNPDDSIISGVCGGLGAYLNTDPVLFRILFVVLTFFGVGPLIYIVLWIALPPANTEPMRKEMYGNSYQSARSQFRQNDNGLTGDNHRYNSGYYNSSRIGNAFNEIFRAIGRVCYVIIRIFLIVIGVCLVLTGFLFILSFIMIFIFKYPGTISHDALNFTLTCLPDFLNYIVNPATAHWVMALTSIAFILPMFALIYWGVKMVIWFKAKDGLYLLAGFVFWVLTVAVLSVIFFSEGVSFATSGRSTATYNLQQTVDTLYVVTDHKASDLKFNTEFAFPGNEYHFFLDDSAKSMYIKPEIRLSVSEENPPEIEIEKRSSGATESAAIKKAESIIYNYRISRDTLYLDDYFTIPSGSKWTADFVNINLNLSEKTVLYFDSTSLGLFHRNISTTRVSNEVTRSVTEYNTEPWSLKDKYWVTSDNPLEEVEKSQTIQQ
jgi:phage shock protein PspC (stress-responsive transcriptional regulator)